MRAALFARNRMTRANGGAERVRDWSRLFLAGCGPLRGRAVDSTGSTRSMRWRAGWSRASPESLTATGAAFPGRSRPLCAYPLHAHYKGQGEDASNFECRP